VLAWGLAATALFFLAALSKAGRHTRL